MLGLFGGVTSSIFTNDFRLCPADARENTPLLPVKYKVPSSRPGCQGLFGGVTSPIFTNDFRLCPADAPLMNGRPIPKFQGPKYRGAFSS